MRTPKRSTLNLPFFTAAHVCPFQHQRYWRIVDRGHFLGIKRLDVHIVTLQSDTARTAQLCLYNHLSYYFSVHAGSFHVSIIHRTLIWNTGSLTCVHDHSCACIYTRELGTPTVSQFTFLTRGKTHKFFLCS